MNHIVSSSTYVVSCIHHFDSLNVDVKWHETKSQLLISVIIIRLFYNKKMRKKVFYKGFRGTSVCMCMCVCVVFNCLAKYKPTKTSSAQSHSSEGEKFTEYSILGSSACMRMCKGLNLSFERNTHPQSTLYSCTWAELSFIALSL